MEILKELSIQFFQDAVSKAGRILSFVPADKLHFKPSDTARSSLEVAAHIGVSIMGLAEMINNRKEKPITIEQLFATLKTEEAKYTTLDSVLSLLERGKEHMVKVLQSIPLSEIENDSITTPFGTRPLKRFIFVPEGHTNGHVAQLDYLQTIWGDVDQH